MADDPAEFGKLAEANKPDAAKLASEAVSVVLMGRLLKMLVDKELLNEGSVIAMFEGYSTEIMRSPTDETTKKTVGFLQIVCDIVAGEVDRKPQ
jgi:hypothetical protein